jgi:dienelactone hydrolase
MRWLLAMMAMVLAVFPARRANADEQPKRVSFPSADAQTVLVGYLFKPAIAPDKRAPAVVMMHGRAGAYSSNANGIYDAQTLSMRHREWGERWAEQGYIALMVDGFGPRGYPQGFSRHSYESRPAELNEVTIRPLDAYGALTYLRSRADVVRDRVGLIGWSNGGSAALATMAVDAPGIKRPTPQTGFRAALVFYPACGLHGHFDESGYRPYGPVRVFHGTADEEVSARRCAELVDRSRQMGGDIDITLYRSATHGFDDPGRKRRSVEANAAATSDAVARSLRFFARHLGGD